MIPNSKPIEVIEDRKKDKNRRKKMNLTNIKTLSIFFTQLKSRFSLEFMYFEYIIHNLFCFYSDKMICFDKCHYFSTRRAIDQILRLQFSDPKAIIPKSLENLIFNDQKWIQMD